jgi:hypothetical protein
MNNNTQYVSTLFFRRITQPLIQSVATFFGAMAVNTQVAPRFSPLHRRCDAMTLLHAQPTHSPELPRSVGRDVNGVTAGGHYR